MTDDETKYESGIIEEMESSEMDYSYFSVSSAHSEHHFNLI